MLRQIIRKAGGYLNHSPKERDGGLDTCATRIYGFPARDLSRRDLRFIENPTYRTTYDPDGVAQFDRTVLL